DIAAAEDNVRRIARHVRSTHGPSVLGSFGAFAGLFHLRDTRDPVLVASTDGVGSKVLLGIQLGRHELLGRDLVNLSANDVLTAGTRRSRLGPAVRWPAAQRVHPGAPGHLRHGSGV